MAGPKFKKVRKPQASKRPENSQRSATNGSHSPLSMPASSNRNASRRRQSNTTSARLPGSSSGNGYESDHTSPLTATSAPNLDVDGHGEPDNSSTPLTPTSGESTRNSGSNVRKNGRGVSRGLNLDKIVDKIGKMKIVFNDGEKIPAANVEEFATGVGIATLTCAELIGVYCWRQIPEANKEICRKRLMTWFEVEDWTTPRVQDIVDRMFQDCYRRWRNTLATCYRTLVRKGKNPREKSPRREVQIAKWLAVCDRIETPQFKKRSLINSANRKKMPFNHTSGKIRYLARYRKMVKKSKIHLWKSTHVDKTGQFVNSVIATAFEKMTELEEAAAAEEGESPMSEDQILESALGYRSGYQKGIGHGVEVPHRKKFQSSATQDSQLNEKLSETQAELDNAKEKINSLTLKFEEQKEQLMEELEEQKARNKSYEEKLSMLQKQMEKMQQLWRNKLR